ncbi:uncharacterized protein VTP21DRAFT_6841 [Calcarisporiella thermophila]|uniref:uncharacterized protein n=1 Tax=Calcarisporiella thermophila TaxID=911321 RepID=UPI0037429F2D
MGGKREVGQNKSPPHPLIICVHALDLVHALCRVPDHPPDHLALRRVATEIFGKYGKIKEIDLPFNRTFNTHVGTAFVIFEKREDAEEAICYMNEGQIDGNPETVLDLAPFLDRHPVLVGDIGIPHLTARASTIGTATFLLDVALGPARGLAPRLGDIDPLLVGVPVGLLLGIGEVQGKGHSPPQAGVGPEVEVWTEVGVEVAAGVRAGAGPGAVAGIEAGAEAVAEEQKDDTLQAQGVALAHLLGADLETIVKTRRMNNFDSTQNSK